MLVDDSAIVRGLISKALQTEPLIEIVATASNGKMAIPMAERYAPDIIILDIEMPEMDGITALPELLKVSPKTKIIMASTLTQRNASISLQALSLGASDYVAKPSARGPEELEMFYHELRSKVIALGEGGTPTPAGVAQSSTAAPSIKPAARTIQLLPATSQKIHALAIASSTGGPQALLQIFGKLNAQLAHIPIFITQHMPQTFTAILAEQLGKAVGRTCIEGKDGEKVKAGGIYVAPGNYHMTVQRDGIDIIIRNDQNPPVNFCRPAADPMFDSLAKVYGKDMLACVLTGMGADGANGAKTVSQAGGAVIAQDEASSVVWGMPRACAETGVCQAVLPLPQIADYLIRRCV